jgi:hypothetical protein
MSKEKKSKKTSFMISLRGEPSLIYFAYQENVFLLYLCFSSSARREIKARATE